MPTEMQNPLPSVHELNRDMFIAWTEGILMDRDQDGKCLVLDGSDFSKRCEAAEKALEGGETIYLTNGQGQRITKMYDAGEGYVEEEV